MQKLAFAERKETTFKSITPQSEAAANLQHDMDDPLLSTLKRIFGFDEFKPGQQEIIESIMAGRDGLVLLPTGGGKTLCFTLPALLSDGLCIVVLPTISLMQDISEKLTSICQTVTLSSLSTSVERDTILQNLPNIKVLLTTPESPQHIMIMDKLKKVTISQIIVDKAHCIDEWGYQFPLTAWSVQG